MDEIIKHLGFLQESSNKTCNYLYDKDLNVIQFFCLGLLRRIDDTTTTTKVLFELLPNNDKHEFTIGIMFRTLILDTLISMNLFELISDLKLKAKSKEEIDKEVIEFCNIFLSDGLNTTINYIDDAEKLKITTNIQTKAAFKNMGNIYNAFFENYQNDGSRPILKYKKKYTAKQLFEKLANSKNYSMLSKIYDGYAYLSKYDHFGIIYYNAINQESEYKMKIYSDAVQDFVAHNSFIHIILASNSNNDSIIDEYSQIAGNYLMKNFAQ